MVEPKLYGTAAIAAEKAKQDLALAEKTNAFAALCARAAIADGEHLHEPEFIARIHARGFTPEEIRTLREALTERKLFEKLA